MRPSRAPGASTASGAALGGASGRALLGPRDGAVQRGVVRPAQRGDARALHAPVLLVGLGAHGEELELLAQVRAVPPGAPGLRGLRGQAADEHDLRAAVPRDSARRSRPCPKLTLDNPGPARPTAPARVGRRRSMALRHTGSASAGRAGGAQHKGGPGRAGRGAPARQGHQMRRDTGQASTCGRGPHPRVPLGRAARARRGRQRGRHLGLHLVLERQRPVQGP